MKAQKMIAAIEQAIIEMDAARKARLQRIHDAAVTANQGLAPTYDCNGRPHAPCDGYEWEDETYGAGEFLVMPELSLDDCEAMDILFMPKERPNKFQYTAKVKTDADTVAALKAHFADDARFEFKTGITFCGNHCNMYVGTNSKKMKFAIEAAGPAIAPAPVTLPTLIGGRQEIEATVKMVKVTEGCYPTPYMVLETDTFNTLYCNVTGGFFDLVSRTADELVGKRVKFTATLEVSEKNNTKGSCKRPVKISLVQQ